MRSSKPEHHLLCLGFGYTAQFLAKRLLGPNSLIPFQGISGTTRGLNATKANAMAAIGVRPIILEGDKTNLPAAITDSTHLLVSAAPPRKLTLEEGPNAENGNKIICPALDIIRTLDTSSLKWIGYLSSNGIYGNHDGAWVDETTPPNPTGARGHARLAAEKAWKNFGASKNIPVRIFRLPGIYGPGRSAIDNLRNGTAKRIHKPGQVFNRMHVDDIAMALEKALFLNPPENIFNLCDDEPSAPQDVITYAAQLIGKEPPPIIDIEQAGLSATGRSFYNDNKRVRNVLMKTALGLELQYPSYREGLQAIFTNETKPNPQ